MSQRLTGYPDATRNRSVRATVGDARLAVRPRRAFGRPSCQPDAMRVALFITCFNDLLYPEVGRATVRLLRRLGVDVAFPQEQTCCGQMHFNTGYRDACVPLVERFTTACAAMVRGHHAIVAAEAGDAGLERSVGEVAPRVQELTEFLVDVLGVEDVGAEFRERVAYHPTCHSLRLLRVGDRPQRLLRAVRGLELVDLAGAEECCGFDQL